MSVGRRDVSTTKPSSLRTDVGLVTSTVTFVYGSGVTEKGKGGPRDL